VRHARAAKKIVLMTDADLPLVMMMKMTWRRDPKKRKAMRRRDPDPMMTKRERRDLDPTTTKRERRDPDPTTTKRERIDLDPTTMKRKRRDPEVRRVTTKRRSLRIAKAEQLNVLRNARNRELSVVRRARDVLKILKSLKKSPRRTVLSLLRRAIKSHLRMVSKNLPRRTRNQLRMGRLPTINPRDLLPRRLLSKRKTTRSTGTSTDPRGKRRDPSTTRVKRGLSVTKKATKKRKYPHSVRKNHAKTRLLVRMRENSSDYKSNDNVAFIKGSGGL
jgi:hypothetical protein